MSLSTIRASNAKFVHSFANRPVAVFVGGTAGVGAAMATSFLEHTNGNSDIVIVGRNRAAAEGVFASAPAHQSSASSSVGAQRDFVECDITLMKNVEAATKVIKEKYPKINYLVMSPGVMTLSGRDETAEGIDKKLALHYYARWKFLADLLPSVIKAKEEKEQGAVISVLGPGYGGRINVDNLAVEENYSVPTVARVAPTYNDLMLEQYALKAPNLAFIHAYPGAVRTTLLATSPSLLLRMAAPLVPTLLRPFTVSPAECAENMWHAAFTTTAGQAGAFRTGAKGENLGRWNYHGNAEQRQKLWDHTVEVMNRALGRT
ncbi:hypothetical protein D9619_009165 [Psilocybe cf. subviscida]|uniref:NAD(P)-binding protein n=1 Tax=Psilocybe cf. subviscida TaxID=2480587 RepID=A0A8H5BTV7_9AGAR|nr:hypothetical protein D9619_009165 [Psilocybe cf. subviscida]